MKSFPLVSSAASVEGIDQLTGCPPVWAAPSAQLSEPGRAVQAELLLKALRPWMCSLSSTRESWCHGPPISRHCLRAQSAHQAQKPSQPCTESNFPEQSCSLWRAFLFASHSPALQRTCPVPGQRQCSALPWLFCLCRWSFGRVLLGWLPWAAGDLCQMETSPEFVMQLSCTMLQRGKKNTPC